MTTISTTKAGLDLNYLVGRVARTRKTMKLRDDKGLFIYLVSQEELDGLKASAELRAIPGMVESILEAGNSLDSDFITEEDFVWHDQ